MDTAKMNPRILIAASGTGGHLMPALYIAQAIQKKSPQADIEFLGSGRPLEETVLGKAGFKRSVVDIVGLKKRGLSGALQFLTKLPAAVFKTKSILARHRPHVVIGVGGYVTFLPVVLGWLSGVPAWIHEAERKPGMANLVLSYFAKKISVAFEDSSIPNRHKTLVTGQPVRPELIALGAEPHEISIRPRLLVMGGSQGARAIDEALGAMADWLKERGIEVWHQCRPENEVPVREAYAKAGVSAQVASFIENVEPAYRWCDIVLARSGAGTVMEIGVVNRPAILVPYPHAQANHQLTNAKTLSSKGKAIVIEEGQDFSQRLQKALSELLNPERYQAMRGLPLVGRKVSAAEAIAEGVLALIR
jgi:UDP-N-acetylglucosamine--N-acetylmuramyl-(pentapeptide) pyrophosphoryl-undecaprenol N-acetylglucosamine transferase